MQCFFCKATGAVPCTWLAWKLNRTPVEQLKPGDTVLLWANELTVVIYDIQPLPPEKIPAWTHGPLLRVVFTFQGQRRYQLIPPVMLVQRLERGRCQQPACEAHVRDVGGNHRYCKDHWDSWKEANEEQEEEAA